MTAVRRAIAAGLLASLIASAVPAQEAAPTPIQRTHDPGLAAAAALLNVFYVPLRVGVTAVVAVLGGFTGFITFGDRAAAEAIWNLAGGPQVLTPEMLEGTEEWHFTGY